MATPKAYRWRKTTDINREHALFELLEGDVAVLDLGFTDEGVLEVSFNPAIDGKAITLDELRTLFNEGQALAEDDK